MATLHRRLTAADVEGSLLAVAVVLRLQTLEGGAIFLC